MGIIHPSWLLVNCQQNVMCTLMAWSVHINLPTLPLRLPSHLSFSHCSCLCHSSPSLSLSLSLSCCICVMIRTGFCIHIGCVGNIVWATSVHPRGHRREERQETGWSWRFTLCVCRNSHAVFTFTDGHVDDKLMITSEFVKIKDDRAGDLEPYLLLLFHNVVTACVVKLSRRADSSEVCFTCPYICSISLGLMYFNHCPCRYCSCGTRQTSRCCLTLFKQIT